MSKLAIFGGTPIGKGEFPAWPIYGQEEADQLLEALNSGVWGINGQKQEEFAQKFAEFCGAKYGVMVTNGTHTLKLALEAMDIGPGDEVIVPASTWQATASSVLDVNAVPVLVDVDPDTYTIDPAAIEAAITSKTRCIIPVHLYGRVCDMDAIMDIAKRYNLKVLEDCAHQHGSEWRGQKVGTIGNAGSFSLQSSKVMNTGEGGIVVTNDPKIYYRLQSMKSCGREVINEEGEKVSTQSGNFRPSEFAAAVGIAQLSRLQKQIEKREESEKYLEEKLQHIPGLGFLRHDDRITQQSIYWLPIKFKPEQWGVDRMAFIRAVRAEMENSIDLNRPYVPLTDSYLYRPFSKKTHKLSDEYCQKINPARYNTPVVEYAFQTEFVGIPHRFLLAEKSELDKFIAAVQKVWDNKEELKAL